MSDELFQPGDRRHTLFDALADSVAELSDDEAIEESREAGEDPKACADEIRGILLRTLAARAPESDAESSRQPGAAADAAPEADTTTYALEVRLTRTRTPSNEKKGRRLRFRLPFRDPRSRAKQDRPPKGSGSSLSLADRLRRTPPWFAFAASAIVVVSVGVGVVDLLREPTPDALRRASEEPATPSDQIASAPAAPSQYEQTEPSAGPAPAPGRAAPSPKQSASALPPSHSPDRGAPHRPDIRGGTRAPLRLADIQTVFVDPQTDSFADAVRTALVAELNASGRLRATEDAATADARLRIDPFDGRRLTVALISGRSIVWTATEPVDTRHPDEAARLARRIADRLLDAAQR
jgi:hypothetical protein